MQNMRQLLLFNQMKELLQNLCKALSLPRIYAISVHYFTICGLEFFVPNHFNTYHKNVLIEPIVRLIWLFIFNVNNAYDILKLGLTNI